MRVAATTLLGLLALGSTVWSQPAFEVASIKPNTSGAVQMVIRTPPSGLIRATNVTPLFLIRFAYDTSDFRIVDAPGWITAEHFDITARAPANTDLPEVRAMLRTLLADRFGLVVNRAAREMSIDVMSAAPGAMALRLRTERCVEAQAPAPSTCGVRVAFGKITGVDTTLMELARALTTMTQRMVVDRTGLEARYDFTLEYTPDTVALMPSAEAFAEFPRIDPMGPSLKTALKDQLGLNLDQGRGPVDVIVVERIARPTPD